MSLNNNNTIAEFIGFIAFLISFVQAIINNYAFGLALMISGCAYLVVVIVVNYIINFYDRY